MTREAQRQQLLVRALWRDDAAVQPWLRAGADRGLAAYRSNAGAIAERALAAAYPTVAALVGDESFAALARHFWSLHPPQRGDLGEWGDALPGFIAANAQLADEPYLADCARLDWALHRATRAADDPAPERPALDALADTDAAQLHARFAPGAAVVPSPWPLVTIWRAHHAGASLDDARTALADGRAEAAFVWRDDGFVPRSDALTDAQATFTAALVAGRALADALDAAGEAFAFDHWLARALGARWLFGFHTRSDTP
jgi:hypothetical protein